jgi:hypothetical protein
MSGSGRAGRKGCGQSIRVQPAATAASFSASMVGGTTCDTTILIWPHSARDGTTDSTRVKSN